MSVINTINYAHGVQLYNNDNQYVCGVKLNEDVTIKAQLNGEMKIIVGHNDTGIREYSAADGNALASLLNGTDIKTKKTVHPVFQNILQVAFGDFETGQAREKLIAKHCDYINVELDHVKSNFDYKAKNSNKGFFGFVVKKVCALFNRKKAKLQAKKTNVITSFKDNLLYGFMKHSIGINMDHK